MFYAYNFFLRYLPSEHQPVINIKKDGVVLRRQIYDDLCILNNIRPLLEANLLQLYTPPKVICLKCLTKGISSPEADKRFQKAREALALEFLENISQVEMQHVRGHYVLGIRGSEPYFQHGMGRVTDTFPKILRKYPNVVSSLRSGARVKLSKKIQRNLMLHRDLAHEITLNIAFDLEITQSLPASFLTHRELHISFLNRILGNQDVKNTNAITSKYLTSLVPFVGDVPLSDLLKLRFREQDAFILFRHALGEAMRTVHNERGTLDKRTAESIYSDILLPRLTDIDRRVRLATDSSIKEFRRSALAWTGVITFGIYSGFLPAQLVPAARVLGAAKIGAEGLKKLMAMSDATDAVKQDAFYFLWRVRRLAKRG